MSVSGKDVQKQSIEISKFWEEELKSMPYLTRKLLLFAYLLIYIFDLQRRTARLYTS